MASLFSKPKMPDIKDPKPLPDLDSEEIKRARRRRVAKEQTTQGAASTVLTGTGKETLGG